MIRYFCDGCGDEMTEKNECVGGNISSARLGTEIKKGKVRLRVEVLTSMDGTLNAGLFCKYCVLDALHKLDDRPREPRP